MPGLAWMRRAGSRLRARYQYYEFRAIDLLLTNQQIRELRGYSSRAEITSTTFTVEYNWGDFKGNPFRWMEKYFDACPRGRLGHALVDAPHSQATARRGNCIGVLPR